jgi:predicted RNase H-like HicB family nuclease
MEKIRYTVVLEWDPEEDLYVATLPALSIGSYGETRDEALEMIKEAAEVTIEGLKETGQLIPRGDEDKIGLVEVAV